jgi:hypothetical protein
MSRSHHVAERQIKRDNWFNRGANNERPEGLSKLDELSLKKALAKTNETWKRDTNNAGGLKRTKFGMKDGKITVTRIKTRGQLSDIPSQ